MKTLIKQVTVKELITTLQKFDQKMPVVINTGDQGDENVNLNPLPHPEILTTSSGEKVLLFFTEPEYPLTFANNNVRFE